jgi:transcription termination factor NusB
MKLDTLLLQLSQAQDRYTVGFKNMYEMRKQLKKVTQTYHDKIITLEEQKAYLLDFLDLYKNNKIKLDEAIENLFETRTQLKNRVTLLVNHIEQTR